MIERDLAELKGQDGGRFRDGNWEVDVGARTNMASEHERLHRVLNEMTSYGALLDAVARLSLSAGDGDRYAVLLKSLVGRARITHEVFATYMSTAHEVASKDRLPPSLVGNAEYLGYFQAAKHFVDLARTRTLGHFILWAVIRIAMNGPLPGTVERGQFEQLKLHDFRSSDSPDQRLLQIKRILSRELCDTVIGGARDYFGSHPHWDLFIEREDGIFNPLDLFSITRQVGDIALLDPGGISPILETDIGNYILDYIWLVLADSGLIIYSLAQRMNIEKCIRDALDQQSERFYDDPADFKQSNLRRDLGRESLRLRSAPLRTFVRTPSETSGADWSLFRSIQRMESFVPVHMRTTEDFLANHDVVEMSAEIALIPGAMVCFLQKQRQLDDNTIGLDVVVLNKPHEILSLRTHIGELRMCMSGQFIAEKWRPQVSAWMEFLDGPTHILLDTHPQKILDGLTGKWEALLWSISRVEEFPGLSFLVLYPVGAGRLPSMGLFRPCTNNSADAVLKAMQPSPIPATLKQLGVPITGLSEEAQRGYWGMPEHLKWTLTRFYREEALFQPQTPETSKNEN